MRRVQFRLILLARFLPPKAPLPPVLSAILAVRSPHLPTTP